MDIIPENTFVSLDTLEKYIEKHPEDAEKWLEFIKVPEKPRRISVGIPEVNQDLLKIHNDIYTIEPEVPVTHYNDGCLFCKKSWASTEGVPTITLICGHKFHTICSMIDQYEVDYTRCIVDECDINTWDYVRKIIKNKNKTVEITENILLESFKKRKDFKEDLKELKKIISEVSGSHVAIRGLIKAGKNEFIHKHLYTLNQMQSEMNDGVKFINSSEQMDKYNKALRLYRKKAALMFRKYHVSYRELREQGLVKTSWHLRWVLERHRTSFHYYKLGFRMYPHKKVWKDPL